MEKEVLDLFDELLIARKEDRLIEFVREYITRNIIKKQKPDYNLSQLENSTDYLVINRDFLFDDFIIYKDKEVFLEYEDDNLQGNIIDYYYNSDTAIKELYELLDEIRLEGLVVY